MAAKKTARKSAKGPRIFTDKPEVVSTGRGGLGEVSIPERDHKAEREAEQAREDAFGAEYEWNGQPVSGLTSGRWGLFLSQRKAVTNIDFLESLVGDAFFGDAVRILYLCSTTKADWRPFRLDAMAWQEEIERWADIHVPIHQRLAAEALAFDLYKNANENRHEPAPPEKGNHGTDSGN